MYNISKLRKAEILFLANNKCSHRHTYLSHLPCAEKEGVSFIQNKILLFDLETEPHQGYYWGKDWDTSIIKSTEYGKILSFAAKWLNGKTYVRGIVDYGNKEELLVKELWKLFNEADTLVAHNGRQFDVRWANSRFIKYGLPAPSLYKVIDTKTLAKKYLYLPDYSLSTIADYYGLGRKTEHEGFGLWLKCMEGDKKAWRRMKKYNLNDVILLEKVYLKLKTLCS